MSETEIIKERAARRAAVKREFLKQVNNPYRHGSGEGGVLFDPALQRFMSMRVTLYDSFKPTPKTSRWGLMMIVFPIVGYGLLMKYDRDSFEKKCRTGQIAYADRQAKFV